MPEVARPHHWLRFSTGHAPNLSAPPTGGSQQPHIAPRTTNQKDRQTRKPTPGTSTAEHATPTPGPPCGDHLTQEHATVNKAPGSTIAAPATQRAHHAHTRCNTSPNSVATRPSLRESYHYHHTHALPSPEDLNASKLNPTRPSGALTIYAYLIFLCIGRVPGNRGWPGHRHPETATAQTIPRDTETPTPPRRV